MVKKFTMLLLLCLAVIVGYFVFFRDSDELKIRRTLKKFCIDCSKKEQSSSAAAVIVKNQVLQNYFTDICRLTLHRSFMYGEYSNVRAANEIMRVNMLLKKSELSISDIDITLRLPEAEVAVTGRFRAELKSGEHVDEVREVILKMRRDGRKWKIHSADIHEILEKQ